MWYKEDMISVREAIKLWNERIDGFVPAGVIPCLLAHGLIERFGIAYSATELGIKMGLE